MSNGNDHTYRSRKWALAQRYTNVATQTMLLILLISTTMLWTESLTADQWVTMVKAGLVFWIGAITFIGAGYGFSNVVEKVGLAREGIHPSEVER